MENNPALFPPVEIIEIPKNVHTARLKSTHPYAPSVNFWAGRGWRGVEYEWNAFGYSPDALKMFERMMRVCKDDLERLFIFKTQHIFDADATHPPKNVCGADAMIAGCSMTGYFSSLLTKVVADFTKFAQALLRSDISTGPPLEPAKIMAELEKCSASNKTLDDQYSRLLHKFNQARRAWVREQYEWKERFMRCDCAAKDWSPNVTFYEDAMWGDEGETHTFYQEKLKAMEDLFEIQISKLNAQIIDMQSEVREKNERIEMQKKMLQDMHKETVEEIAKVDAQEAGVQAVEEVDVVFCQVPQDLHYMTHENPCMFHEVCTTCGFGKSEKTEEKKVRQTVVTKESATMGSRVRKGPGGMLLHIETGDTESLEWSCGSLIAGNDSSGKYKVYFDDPEALHRAVNVKDLDNVSVEKVVRRMSHISMLDQSALDSDGVPQSSTGLLNLLPSLPQNAVAAFGFDCIEGEWQYDKDRIVWVPEKDYNNFLPDLKRLLGPDHELVTTPVHNIRKQLQRQDQAVLLEQGILCVEGVADDILFGIDRRHFSDTCKTFFTRDDGQFLANNMQQKVQERGVQAVEHVKTTQDREAVHEAKEKCVRLERVSCAALHIKPAKVEQVVVSSSAPTYDLDVITDKLTRLRTELSSKVMPLVTKPLHEPRPATVKENTRVEAKKESALPQVEGDAANAAEWPLHAHAPTQDAGFLSPIGRQVEMSVQTDLECEVSANRIPSRSPTSARNGTARGKSPRPEVGEKNYQLPPEKEKTPTTGGSVIHALSRWRLGALPTLLTKGYHMLEPLKLSELASALCDADLPCSEADLQMLFAVGQGGKCRPSSTVTLKLLFGRLHRILFGSREMNHEIGEPRPAESARSGDENFERLSTVEIAFRRRQKVQSEFECFNEPIFRSTFGGGFRARDSSSDTGASSRPQSGLQNARRPKPAHTYSPDANTFFSAELVAGVRTTSPPPLMLRGDAVPAAMTLHRRPGSTVHDGGSVALMTAPGDPDTTTLGVPPMEVSATSVGLPSAGRVRGIISTGDLRSNDRAGVKKRETGGASSTASSRGPSRPRSSMSAHRTAARSYPDFSGMPCYGPKEKIPLAEVMMGEAYPATWICPNFPQPKSGRESRDTSYLPRSIVRSLPSSTIKSGKLPTGVTK